MAVDLDEGINAELRYSIAGSGAERFEINEVTGELTVSSVGVDYEQVFDVPYTLTVIANDLGEVISLLRSFLTWRFCNFPQVSPKESHPRPSM